MKTNVEFSRNLFEVLIIIKTLFRDEVNESARKTKLTLPQYRILVMIRHNLNQISKMAEEVGISQPAMSKSVDVLVDSGLIKRTDHPTDRRQIVLQLTGKAQQLVTELEEGVCQRINNQFKKVSDTEIKTITNAMSRMLELLGPGPK